MKTIKIITMMCIMLFSYSINSNAQTASKVGKIVKEFVKKGSKKSSKTKTKSSKTTRVRYQYVDCNTCNGKGQVNVWNSYYNVWQTQDCNRCSGTGKVKRN